uniref:Uncharacterized protein n=1 Tax=Zea mays TaxID=4577 RepID=B4FEE0_MAIZE|nr:unknown [Zea mays]
MDHEPKDAVPPRDAGSPRHARVGDEAVRQPGQRAEVRLERLGEQPHGIVERDDEGDVVQHVDPLAARGEAERWPRERELGEVDGEPRPRGLLQEGPVARGVDGRQHHRGTSAVAGDEARQVQHGEQVALRQHRHEHEVRRCCSHGTRTDVAFSQFYSIEHIRYSLYRRWYILVSHV